VNIRPKVIAWIAATFAILGLAEVLLVRHIIMPSFAELERTDARTAMRRIQYAFDLTLDRLGVLAVDWGNWSLVYRFMQDHKSETLEADITLSNIREIDVNLVLIVDPYGTVTYSRAVDLPANQTLDMAAWRRLPNEFPWRENLRAGKPAKGLLPTNLGTLMLAGGPILDGDGHGPSRGMMILGRLLKAAEINSIAAQAQSSLFLLPAPASHRPDRLTQTPQITHVDRDFADIFGRPIMTLRVDVPREITAHGRKAVAYASAGLVAAAVIFVILLVAVISRVILNPLAVVTRHAVVVGEDKDLTTRLDLKRQDEIGVLAREFDRMVEHVAESRAQLVDQSFEAGFAELAKGVLHNLGNAVTPIGVRLATLLQRLRSAPAGLAEQAATELEDGVTDPERCTDLKKFLRLACSELAATLRLAENDVVVMSDQAGAIRSLLTEQMRSTRNEHVIEAVRLPALLAQALDIVPDAHRRRLEVHSDDSLRRVGVVRIARTMLRLVLQNIIINAADAVHDAGKGKGVLRVSAQIVREGDREQLHLVCQDDGVGIAESNLTRLFDKGFSTKSSEARHGTGLHWCANAIGTLGGRIWATSDGMGCGASIHLRVPLGGVKAPAPEAPVLHSAAPGAVPVRGEDSGESPVAA
jgi:two-component system NtrC family sensor kinase